jgi:hypothetical protein
MAYRFARTFHYGTSFLHELLSLLVGRDRVSFALWGNQADFAEPVNGVIGDHALQEGKCVDCLPYAGVLFLSGRPRRAAPTIRH